MKELCRHLKRFYDGYLELFIYVRIFVLTKFENRMIHIIREISKLCMFTILWAFPVLLSRWNGNSHYLWFFALSLVVTVGVFSHYEDLEKIDNFNSDNDGSNE